MPVLLGAAARARSTRTSVWVQVCCLSTDQLAPMGVRCLCNYIIVASKLGAREKGGKKWVTIDVHPGLCSCCWQLSVMMIETAFEESACQCMVVYEGTGISCAQEASKHPGITMATGTLQTDKQGVRTFGHHRSRNMQAQLQGQADALCY